MDRRSRLGPETFDPVNASHGELLALHGFNDLVLAELDPDGRRPSAASTIRSHRSISALTDIDVYMWVVWDGPAIVAHASAEIVHRPENPHALQLSPIRVLPEYRRQGLATALLARILELAVQHEKRLLLNTTDSRVPAGDSFAVAIGAEPGGQGQVFELELARIEDAEMQAITEVGSMRAPGYEVGFWPGQYPDSELEGVAALKQAMNTIPTAGIDIDLTERVTTPMQLRDREAYLFDGGSARWTVFARHTRSRELAGFTEIIWNRENPENLMQGETGVLPKHRGRGLALWMKAAMIREVLRSHADAKRIRTTNATRNETMLRINRSLGFRPTWTDREWQARIECVQNYLDSRRRQ